MEPVGNRGGRIKTDCATGESDGVLAQRREQKLRHRWTGSASKGCQRPVSVPGETFQEFTSRAPRDALGGLKENGLSRDALMVRRGVQTAK